MNIQGIQGLTVDDLRRELARGGRFVTYRYCISVLVLTFRRSSGVYFVRADENAVTKGLGWTVMTLLLGWWGIPWGPIYSVSSLYQNLHGGVDVTAQVRQALQFDTAGGSLPPPLPGSN